MTAHEHCLHEILRYDYRNGHGDGSQARTMRCCHCGESERSTFMAQKDPDHGPFAPLVVPT